MEEKLQASNYLKKELNIKTATLDNVYISPELISMISKEIVQKYQIMPFRVEENRLLVAMVDPYNEIIKEEIRFLTGMEVEAYKDTKYNIFSAIENYYERQTVNEVLKEFNDVKYDIVHGEKDDKVIKDAPIVRLTNSIINQAIKLKASDIHLEPFKDIVKIRFRIDGVLNEILTIPKEVYNLVNTRIKIKSYMDISKKMIPQDGKMEYRFKESILDLRTSSIPTVNGEKIVIRILYKFSKGIYLNEIVKDERDLNLIKDILKHPSGMVIVTGPTGSGKTTTLASMLNHLNSKEKNIITIEDPVEYDIDGINQMNVNNKAGLTFGSGLRSILRQDPDIIMVGEIRDSETADIAIRAAITGHLVVSTLHTRDAASTAMRLSDMGVCDYLIADSLVAVISQRLIREICPYCKEDYTPSHKELNFLKLNHKITLHKGKGCKFCNGSGYKGRRAVFEIMYLDDTHREFLRKKESISMIKNYSVKNGMVSINEKYRNLVLEGITTIDEIMRNAYGNV